MRKTQLQLSINLKLKKKEEAMTMAVTQERMEDRTRKHKLGISSVLDGLKAGDKVYTSDFVSDGSTEKFDTKTFIIDKVLTTKIDGTDTAYYVMHDERFPKGSIKSDLKTGYFLSEKDAQEAFVDTIEFIAQRAREQYEKNYSK